MFQALFISTFLLATVYCDLSAFEDSEALVLAQEKSGALLEPPKEVYEKIHKDLAAIRKAYPVVANVKHHSDFVPGSIECHKFTKEGANKLNVSEFGPIKEQTVMDYDIITFPKPYNSPVLLKVLKEKGLATDCVVGFRRLIGMSAQLTIGADNTYNFYKGSGDCPAGCINKHYWTFSVEQEKVTLVKETGHGIESTL